MLDVSFSRGKRRIRRGNRVGRSNLGIFENHSLKMEPLEDRHLLATLTLINAGTDDRIDTITELDIGGTMYNVTFHHGVTLNSLGASGFTFTNQTAAETALNAIGNFVDGTPHGSTATNLYAIPYNNNVDAVYRTSTHPSQYSFMSNAIFPITNHVPSTMLNSDDAWATFVESSSAAPEILVEHQPTNVEIPDGDTSPTGVASEGTDFGMVNTAAPQ